MGGCRFRWVPIQFLFNYFDHVFTHFALTARLLCAEAEARVEGTWWPVARVGEAGLPTLFAKLAARGAAWQGAA